MRPLGEIVSIRFKPPSSEVYVSPAEAARNRGTWAVAASGKGAELGVNRPEASGEQGRKLNLYA